MFTQLLSNLSTTSSATTSGATTLGAPQHAVYPLHQHKFVVIGRDDECHIPLPVSKISRQHCRIFWHQDGYVVEDLRSKNGTYVNGKPCNQQQPLEDGDEIQIGFGAKLLFESNQLQMVGNVLL